MFALHNISKLPLKVNSSSKVWFLRFTSPPPTHRCLHFCILQSLISLQLYYSEWKAPRPHSRPRMFAFLTFHSKATQTLLNYQCSTTPGQEIHSCGVHPNTPGQILHYCGVHLYSAGRALHSCDVGPYTADSALQSCAICPYIAD